MYAWSKTNISTELRTTPVPRMAVEQQHPSGSVASEGRPSRAVRFDVPKGPKSDPVCDGWLGSLFELSLLRKGDPDKTVSVTN